MKDQLILVCGIPASGKTTIIEKILKHKDSKLCRLLNLDHNLNYNTLQAIKLDKHPELLTGNLIIHYDIVDRFNNNKFDFLDEFLNKYENSLFIILMANKEELNYRYRLRYIKKFKKYIQKLVITFLFERRIIKNFPRECFYFHQIIEENELIFQKWIKYVKELNVRNIIFLDSSKNEYQVINKYGL